MLVSIAPGKVDGVVTNGLGSRGLGGLLEHRQAARRGLLRLAWDAPILLSLFIAKRARACIAQIAETVAAAMSVLPLDVHAGPAGDVDVHALRRRDRCWLLHLS